VNKTIRKTRWALTTTVLLASAAAQADWSANVGYASNYFYRGIFQAPSSASGGFDYESNGFYAGTWAADVDDGLEIDGYFGYNGSVGDDFSYGIGFTGYYYTGDFDDTYQEINLSAAYGIATLEVAVGEYDAPVKQDYTWYSLKLEKNGFYGRFAGFAQDFAGNYVELGYDFSLAEIDLGIKAILSDDDLTGEADQSLVFTVGKSFDL
jgi:uncharacterized protein (TIGR02001 family)